MRKPWSGMSEHWLGMRRHWEYTIHGRNIHSVVSSTSTKAWAKLTRPRVSRHACMPRRVPTTKSTKHLVWVAMAPNVIVVSARNRVPLDNLPIPGFVWRSVFVSLYSRHGELGFFF